MNFEYPPGATPIDPDEEDREQSRDDNGHRHRFRAYARHGALSNSFLDLYREDRKIWLHARADPVLEIKKHDDRTRQDAVCHAPADSPVQLRNTRGKLPTSLKPNM
jgi:hypothetical protein